MYVGAANSFLPKKVGLIDEAANVIKTLAGNNRCSFGCGFMVAVSVCIQYSRPVNAVQANQIFYCYVIDAAFAVHKTQCFYRE